MAFDAAKYKNSVLVPLAKDKARLEVLQQVIREVQGAGGASAAARLNVSELFAVEPGLGAPELAAHLKSLGMTYNKQKNLPSAGLLKKLLALFGNDKVCDPGFWASLASLRRQALKNQLAEFARAVAQEYPLKVMSPAQVQRWATVQGSPASELAAALVECEVEVWSDFELPRVTIPSSVRRVTTFPEFRTLVDLVTWPRPAIDVEVLDPVHLCENNRAIPPDEFGEARNKFLRQQSGVPRDAALAAQSALAAMSELRTSVETREFVLASVVELARGALGGGLPRLLVVEGLVSRGVHPGDAARIVAKLSDADELHGTVSINGDLSELGAIRGSLESVASQISRFIEDRSVDTAAFQSVSSPDARSGEIEVSAVLSRSLGVRVDGADVSPRVLFLLPANSPLPAEATVTMQTVVDGQTSISVALYEQGGEVESDDLEDNTLLGETSLDLPPVPAASAVEISLSVSAEGVMRLAARDPFNGRLSSVEANVSVLEDNSAAVSPAAVASMSKSSTNTARSPVFGVHLGSTHAAVARMNDLGQAEGLPNFEGSFTTPSVVYFEGANDAVVGAEAKRVQLSDPDNSCSLIRRHMGTLYPQEFRGQEYTPEAISALILKAVTTDATSELGQEVSKVVITVPAYFGIQEKEATKQAGQIAGLEVVGLVTEPVAALLSVGLGESPETILVFDLGGMSFDVTVLQASPAAIEIVAIDGNLRFGGADWDEALAQLIADKFVAQAGFGDENPRLDAEFEIELIGQAEDVKKSLTRREIATVRCRYYDRDEQVAVTRAEFEAATQHLVAQTLEISQRVVSAAEAKVPELKVDRVLLVGGSSKMPMIDTALREQLGWNPVNTDFEVAAAQGAAIYGALLHEDHSSGGCSCCEEHFREARDE
ncbi:Hsp70 family protein [Nocardioides sp. HDW12B]|uniref:Hsp70 family protein n=1 Tax=Nocardioides sp. HDW12B TaxID=2714939 RepID=UPI00140C375C|nr:Hsp70 family protein [Nocardioides sp. HDW12B]QIK67380.1 Hsp70 family protein [Nocardioides sp. HDW12B]